MSEKNLKKDFYGMFAHIKEDKELVFSFLVSTIFCWITYGAYYCNYYFYGDITVYSHHKELFYIPNGARWFAQLIGLITVRTNIRWLDGVLTSVFMSFSVYIICNVLEIKKKLSIVLVAGICTVHESIWFGHFYGGYGFVIVLMITCISVFVWSKDGNRHIRVLKTAFFIMLSLGAYGAYTPFGMVLVIIILLYRLIQGFETKKVFYKGVEYIVSFLIGMIMYYAVVRISVWSSGVPLPSYMGENRLDTGFTFGELINNICIAYKKSFQYFSGIFIHWHPGFVTMPTVVSFILFIVFLFAFVFEIWRNKQKFITLSSMVLLIFLVLVFPLAAGLIYVLAFNNVHFLMLFSFAGIYMAYIKMADSVLDGGRVKTIAANIMALGLIITICRGFLVTNLAASRLDHLEKITERIASSVINRVETCNGFEGDETVVLVGGVNDSEYYHVDEVELRGPEKILDGVPYANYTVQNNFTYDSTLREYLNNILGCNLRVLYMGEAETADLNDLKEAIHDMPHYPLNGSVKKVDDYIVVKFKEVD